MEIQTIDNESLHSRMFHSGVNKCFFLGFIITISLGALNFGYCISVMGLYMQSLKCMMLSEGNYKYPDYIIEKYNLHNYTEYVVHDNNPGVRHGIGLVNAIVQFGGIFGVFFVPNLQVIISKKWSMYVANFTVIVGSLLIVFWGHMPPRKEGDWKFGEID